MGCESVKVRDGLRGINVLWLVYSSPDVVIFSADLTRRFKWREPAWLISCDGSKRKMELVWLGGPKDRRKTVINFGKKFTNGWCPVMSVSRHTLEVIFYRQGLREKSIERKPLFERR